MAEMDAKRAANFRRWHCCGKCGSSSLSTVDGAEVGGMPGITYRYCAACGHADPVVKRQQRRKLE